MHIEIVALPRRNVHKRKTLGNCLPGRHRLRFNGSARYCDRKGCSYADAHDMVYITVPTSLAFMFEWKRDK